MKTLGERLKIAREKKRFTQLEVAKKLDISNGAISGYERNYRDPDTETLMKLATLYEVTPNWLLGKETIERQLPKNQTEFVISELVEKYNVDLKAPGAKEKLEQIIQLVFGDMKR